MRVAATVPVVVLNSLSRLQASCRARRCQGSSAHQPAPRPCVLCTARRHATRMQGLTLPKQAFMQCPQNRPLRCQRHSPSQLVCRSGTCSCFSCRLERTTRASRTDARATPVLLRSPVLWGHVLWPMPDPLSGVPSSRPARKLSVTAHRPSTDCAPRYSQPEGAHLLQVAALAKGAHPHSTASPCVPPSSRELGVQARPASGCHQTTCPC